MGMVTKRANFWGLGTKYKSSRIVFLVTSIALSLKTIHVGELLNVSIFRKHLIYKVTLTRYHGRAILEKKERKEETMSFFILESRTKSLTSLNFETR